MPAVRRMWLLHLTRLAHGLLQVGRYLSGFLRGTHTLALEVGQYLC